MGHWILFGKRWPKRYYAPRVLSWPMDPRNHQVYGHKRGRVLLLGDPRPANGLSSVADDWPRAPFWDAVVDLRTQPSLQPKEAAARSKLAVQGVGLADEHLAREIIGRLLGRVDSDTDAPQTHQVKPIWTLFDSLSPRDLNRWIGDLTDPVVADHLPPGWDLDRYHQQVAALAKQQADHCGDGSAPDRALRAGVTWADYWQACALLDLPMGPDGLFTRPDWQPGGGLLRTCALVWKAGWQGDREDLDAFCDQARIMPSPSLREAIARTWPVFSEWFPADQEAMARQALRPPERSPTSPPILRPGHLLWLAWEARRSRWQRREPDYFQQACDRVDVRDDREMREAIGVNWRRIDSGFFQMADPTIGPPPRPI